MKIRKTEVEWVKKDLTHVDHAWVASVQSWVSLSIWVDGLAHSGGSRVSLADRLRVESNLLADLESGRVRRQRVSPFPRAALLLPSSDMQLQLMLNTCRRLTKPHFTGHRSTRGCRKKLSSPPIRRKRQSDEFSLIFTFLYLWIYNLNQYNSLFIFVDLNTIYALVFFLDFFSHQETSYEHQNQVR